MVPVTEIVAIDNEKSTADAVRLVRRRGFHRLPAYEGDSNNVVGIVTLTTWDLLDPDVLERPLSELTKPAYYVSPHDPLEGLLPVLRNREDQMAIVVDEYGSTVGMITQEDLMGAVVGELDVGREFEEYAPKHARKYEEVADGVYLMDGRLPIQEINDVLGLELPATEFHTIGGMLVARLHHLCKKRESVTEAGYRFTVVEANDRVVERVRAERDKFA